MSIPKMLGHRTILVLTTFCLSSYAPVFGQSITPSDDSRNMWQAFTYDMGNVFQGIGYSYTRPLHWKGKEWATFGAVVGGTGVNYLMDDAARDFFMGVDDDVPKFIQDYGASIGTPEVNYMFTGGVYAAGLFAKNEKLRRTGVLLIASASSAGILQQIAKLLVGRARPISGQSKDTFDPFNSDRNFHSFFAGHAVLAFSNAYAIGKQFKNPWVKGGIYAVGLIPGVSRLWDDQHWFSDVALGVVISIFTVESIDRYLDRKYDQKYNQQQKKVSWNLNFGPGQIGVSAYF